MGEVVIVVDTSGSIGSDELEQFVEEINAIVNEEQADSEASSLFESGRSRKKCRKSVG